MKFKIGDKVRRLEDHRDNFRGYSLSRIMYTPPKNQILSVIKIDVVGDIMIDWFFDKTSSLFWYKEYFEKV